MAERDRGSCLKVYWGTRKSLWAEAKKIGPGEVRGGKQGIDKKANKRSLDPKIRKGQMGEDSRWGARYFGGIFMQRGGGGTVTQKDERGEVEGGKKSEKKAMGNVDLYRKRLGNRDEERNSREVVNIVEGKGGLEIWKEGEETEESSHFGEKELLRIT